MSPVQSAFLILVLVGYASFIIALAGAKAYVEFGERRRGAPPRDPAS